MKRLSIVIPVYNKYAYTKSCLNDLSKLPNDHEIIIVDNGSYDETYRSLINSKEILYIRNTENLGFGKASNIGYENSSSNNVLFLNNDIKVNANFDNWTEPLIEKCDKGIVGPTMGQLDNELNFVKEENKVLYGNSYMSGWCLASSKDNFKKLDLSKNEIFSHSYFVYFEDTDLSFRARKKHIPFFVVNIPVIHYGRVSSKQLDTNKLYIESRKIFVSKHGKKKQYV